MAMAAPEPATTKPGGDSIQLLRKHCLSCHVIEKISRYRKSREQWEQWEQTLANMIKEDGIVLTETEKTTLLEYLSVPKKLQRRPP
jgi:hypothetical protein